MLVRCFAKINVHLDVIGKRADGYHDLESVFLNVSLFDLLRVEKSRETRLTVDGEASVQAKRLGVDLEGDNLLLKVWDHFHREYGVPPVSLSLTKRIPVGAGLGGGSADAAGLMLALDRLCGLALGDTVLAGIGRRFGADVPFSLKGGAAAVTGIGEQIDPFPLGARLWIVLAWPGVPSPTAEAYRRVRLEARPTALAECRTLLAQRDAAADAAWMGRLSSRMRNSFEDEVAARLPEVARLIACMRESSEAVRMSGSGSSVFSLFVDEECARSAWRRLQGSYPASWLLGPVPAGVELI